MYIFCDGDSEGEGIPRVNRVNHLNVCIVIRSLRNGEGVQTNLNPSLMSLPELAKLVLWYGFCIYL